MKAKMTKYGPYILLGLVFLMLVFLNLFYQDHWLDSDMAAEMMFSKLLAEKHHIFATPDWYYSTEFRFLYTQLVMGPLFLILDNWHVIRMLTNIVFYGVMLLSYFYFMKPLRVSRGLTVLSAVLLLLPFSETMMTHMQMGNTYLSHVIICFFFFGMFLRLVGGTDGKRPASWLLYVCYTALGVICGVSGVRYLLALQCPLVLASLFYLIGSREFQSFRREAAGREIFSLRGWNGVRKSSAAKYLFYSLWGAAASVAGYGINVLWVSRQYVFQTYDATNFISVYQGVLFERLQNAIGCLLMLFGYIPDKGFLSLRGVISMIAFVLPGICLYCTVKALSKTAGIAGKDAEHTAGAKAADRAGKGGIAGKGSEHTAFKQSADRVRANRFFVGCFVAVAFLLNLFVFVFTTSTMVPRYYITIFIFVLPLIAFYFEEKHPLLDKAFMAITLTVCLTLSTGKTVMSFITVDKNESKRPVAEFLAENNYHFGYATYWNANIFTELTDGEVEIANIGDPQYLEYFKWSTPKKYYEEGYHEGETFLLLTGEECARFEETKALRQGRKVYDDGAYSVFVFDSVKTLMGLAEQR